MCLISSTMAFVQLFLIKEDVFICSYSSPWHHFAYLFWGGGFVMRGVSREIGLAATLECCPVI
jgi:hypothetical protein